MSRGPSTTARRYADPIFEIAERNIRRSTRGWSSWIAVPAPCGLVGRAPARGSAGSLPESAMTHSAPCSTREMLSPCPTCWRSSLAIRSDDITTIIKSAIDQFDAGVETRSVGTVVEVGDGIAQVYGLEGALASGAARVPGRRDGHGPQPRGGDGRRGHPRRLHADQGRRPGQDHRPRGRGAGRRRADRPRGRSARPPDRRQGPHRRHQHPAGRAHRARRHRAQERRHARSRRASRRSTR